MAESLIVGTIVAASTAYAVWSLMPRAWRQSLERRFGRSGSVAGCAGCSGCAPDPSASRPVTIVRRR